MNSEIFNDEKMLNEVFNAFDLDCLPDVNIDQSLESRLESQLTFDQIETYKNNLDFITVFDYREVGELGAILSNVKYLGWSVFFSDYIKIHIIIDNKYYDFCVMKANNFENNFKWISKKSLILFLNGFRTNIYNKDYPLLSLAYKPKKRNDI